MRCPECSCLDRPGEPAPRRWARARPPPGAVCGQRAGRLASLTGPCSVPVTCARGPSLSHVTGAVPVPVLTRVLAAPSPRATAPRGAYLATGPGGRRVAGGVPLSPVLEGSVGAPCAPSGAAALPGTEQLPDLSCPAGDPAPFQTVRLSSPRVLRRLCGYTGYLVVTRGHPALHPRVVESRGVRPWPCSLARSLWSCSHPRPHATWWSWLAGTGPTLPHLVTDFTCGVSSEACTQLPFHVQAEFSTVTARGWVSCSASRDHRPSAVMKSCLCTTGGRPEASSHGPAAVPASELQELLPVPCSEILSF
ncbi:guanine nucleotide-binding protein G(I)/G(S)/G(O) subunit gamma-13 isoform X1 [Manis javanica]|uniref:guanine nucleotide-binding protein G(I)/G(S)/G(O) subunit gamma-13 isoform X1 n=1 Tax=Manis javanica TaxID=9974 RepID=UPI00187940B8|nr:guanine nucleotide-binding protein G(I)/G(S)/G(O) subunit gamma-13 isoform X1 [Manis javanica]